MLGSRRRSASGGTPAYTAVPNSLTAERSRKNDASAHTNRAIASHPARRCVCRRPDQPESLHRGSPGGIRPATRHRGEIRRHTERRAANLHGSYAELARSAPRTEPAQASSAALGDLHLRVAPIPPVGRSWPELSWAARMPVFLIFVESRSYHPRSPAA